MKPSKFPASWAAADPLMGAGPEKALALPWHLYLSFSWTQGRVVANPAPSYFRREVISGDNIELGPLRTESDRVFENTEPVSLVYAPTGEIRVRDTAASHERSDAQYPPGTRSQARSPGG